MIHLEQLGRIKLTPESKKFASCFWPDWIEFRGLGVWAFGCTNCQGVSFGKGDERPEKRCPLCGYKGSDKNGQ